MTDSKKKSIVEIVSGKIVSFLIGILINGLILTSFGMDGGIVLWSSLSAVFVVIASIRSYLWRRMFNRLGEDFLKWVTGISVKFVK